MELASSRIDLPRQLALYLGAIELNRTADQIEQFGRAEFGVHMGPGLRVRNFLRRFRGVCAWTDEELDDCWAEVVLFAAHGPEKPAEPSPAIDKEEHGMSGEIVLIGVGSLKPSPKNPRLFRRNPAFEDLVESVRTKGVLQPLMVRPVEDHFEIVFGERRFRAACEAELATVPCQVRELSEAEALHLTIAENAHREDLTPLEELRSVEFVLEQPGYTLEMAAAELGHTVRWVSERRVLSKLSPSWLKAITPGGPHEERRLGELSMVARFPHHVQDALLAEFSVEHSWHLAYARSTLARQMMTLEGVPWDLDNGMIPREGGEKGEALPACSGCLERTDVQPELFQPGEFGRDGEAHRCLNASCFGMKARFVTALRYQEEKKRHPKLVVVSRGGTSYNEREAVEKTLGIKLASLSWDWKEVKQGAKGSFPVLIATGSMAGELKWYSKPDSAAGAGKEKPVNEPVKPLHERLAAAEEAFRGKCNKALIEAVAAAVDDFGKGKGLSCDAFWGVSRAELIVLLARVAAVVGTISRYDWYTGAALVDLRAAADSEQETAEMLARQVCPVLATRLSRHAKQATLPDLAREDGAIAEARWICEQLLRVSCDANTFPDAHLEVPKALAKLRLEAAAAPKPKPEPKKGKKSKGAKAA